MLLSRAAGAACWVVVTGASIAPTFQRDGARALRGDVMNNATLSAAEFIMVDSFESEQWSPNALKSVFRGEHNLTQRRTVCRYQKSSVQAKGLAIGHKEGGGGNRRDER